MREAPETEIFEVEALKQSPVYFISARATRGRNGRDADNRSIELLLGENLCTTSVCFGDRDKRRANLRWVIVRTDSPGGLGLEELRNPKNPFEIFATVSPEKPEHFYTEDRRLNCTVLQSGMPQRRLYAILQNTRVLAPTVAVTRAALARPELFPELADHGPHPHFGDMAYIASAFPELMQKIRKTLSAPEYRVFVPK